MFGKCFSKNEKKNGQTEKKKEADAAGGSLSSVNQLSDLYANLLKQKDVEDGLKEVFQSVRIAVFGRSGSGKTTLIRLILGENGPQTISDGTSGVQDIHHEWRCPDPELPIIIHDSNGMDIQGQERVDTIKAFLDVHQNNSQFSEHIHLVWYIISAGDTRILDDGGVMELISSYKIPLLLVMTHDDWKEASRQNVTESVLDKLLSGVKEKERVKRQMVRVANRVWITENKGLVEDEVNKEALKAVTQSTKELINKMLRYTWVASQAVDMDGKLKASAKIIVSYKKKAFFTSTLGILPLGQQVKLSLMFLKILKSLCKIWRVPPNLERALATNIAMSEGSKSVIQNILKNMMAVVGLAATLAGTVLTGGMLSPLVLGVVASYGAMDSKHTTILLMNYSCIILGSILYVKSNQLTRDNWDADKPQDEYAKLFIEFATCRHIGTFKTNVRLCHSTWDTLMQTKKHKHVVKNQIVRLFQDMLLNRPNSLFSLMKTDELPQQDQLQAQQDTLNINHDDLLLEYGNSSVEEHPSYSET